MAARAPVTTSAATDEPDAARTGRGRHPRRILAVRLALAAAVLIGCGIAAVLLITGRSAPVQPVPARVLVGPPQPTRLGDVQRAITALYRRHPDIIAFDAHGVQYSATTRDKVLSVCSKGSIAANATQLETERVLACAPLIYFFASYGEAHSDSAAIDVARHLYWYAQASNRAPDDETGMLTDLLHDWGLH